MNIIALNYKVNTAGVLPLSEPVPIFHREEVRRGRFWEGGEAGYSARVILGLDPANLNLDYAIGPITQKNNIIDSDKVSVYPNPATDLINITFETETVKESVFELYDIGGRIILSNKIQAKTIFYTINLNAVKGGIYYYKLMMSDEIIANNKIVILNK